MNLKCVIVSSSGFEKVPGDSTSVEHRYIYCIRKGIKYESLSDLNAVYRVNDVLYSSILIGFNCSTMWSRVILIVQ